MHDVATDEGGPGATDARFWQKSREILATVTRDGRLIRANPRWTEVLGWSEQELANRSLDELRHPDDKESAARERERLVVGGPAGVPFESRYRCRDGSYRWLEWSAAFNPVSGVFNVAARDVTDRRHADEQRAQARDELNALNLELEARVERRTAQLTEANRELEAFSHSVAHDLRAPLRAIDGFTQIVLEDNAGRLAEGSEHDLGRVRAASRKMATIIDELLALSLLARRPVDVEHVDVSALAREVDAELAADEPGRDVAVEVEDGLEAHCDPQLMRIVLENLLSNARKFTGPTDDARIAVRRDVAQDGESAFVVEDNGAGFDQRYADKLFTPFERLHSQQEFPGTGVGLTTVSRIVARHGGRVHGESTPGQGACFHVSLPSGQEA